MFTTQACGTNVFPYFVQGLRGIGLKIGEFVWKVRKALLETKVFVWEIHWSLKLSTPTTTCVHATFQNKYLLAQLIYARHLMLPSPLLFSFDTSTFPIKPSSPGNLCSREKLAQNPLETTTRVWKGAIGMLTLSRRDFFTGKEGGGCIGKARDKLPKDTSLSTCPKRLPGGIFCEAQLL